jgi:hypothetical protein
MANHSGFVFMSPDGRYLQRSSLLSSKPTPKILWRMTTMLDCAHLFPHEASLDNIRYGEGFEDLCQEFDIGLSDVHTFLTPVPARSLQKIVIGREE